MGRESYTPNEEDRAFMEMAPALLTDAVQRLAHDDKAGKLEGVIACFGKVYVLVAKVKEGCLAISVNKEEALLAFKEIMPQVLKLAH